MELLLAATYLGPLVAAVIVGLLSRRVAIITMVNMVTIAVAAVPHALMLKNWVRAATGDWTKFLHRVALAYALMLGVSLLSLGTRMLISSIKAMHEKD